MKKITRKKLCELCRFFSNEVPLKEVIAVVEALGVQVVDDEKNQEDSEKRKAFLLIRFNNPDVQEQWIDANKILKLFFECWRLDGCLSLEIECSNINFSIDISEIKSIHTNKEWIYDYFCDIRCKNIEINFIPIIDYYWGELAKESENDELLSVGETMAFLKTDDEDDVSIEFDYKELKFLELALMSLGSNLINTEANKKILEKIKNVTNKKRKWFCFKFKSKWKANLVYYLDDVLFIDDEHEDELAELKSIIVYSKEKLNSENYRLKLDMFYRKDIEEIETNDKATFNYFINFCDHVVLGY